MTSKRLFANLIRENSKRRLWPIALSIAGNFFAQIVFAILMIGRYSERLESNLSNINDIRADYAYRVAGVGNVPVLIIVAGLAFVLALQGYYYLFDGRQTDLYYSLPVRRQKIFDAFNIVGILSFVIPYIICHLITVIVGLTRGYLAVQKLPLIVLSAVLIIVQFIVYYELFVLAAVLTGHVVVAALGCGVFVFLGPAVALLKASMMETFFSSYYEEVTGRVTLFKCSPFSVQIDIINAITRLNKNAADFHAGEVLIPLATALIVSAICFIISRVLIDRRPAEAAGKAMAFEITKPVIKVVIMVVAAIGGGIVMYYISDMSLLTFVFGMVCGILAVHFVIETIYEFDFKASFSHFGSLGIGAAASAIILLSFVFDIFGFESWQPMPNRVESVAIADYITYSGMGCPYYRTTDMPDPDRNAFYSVSGTEFAMKNMKLTDLENVEKITRQGAINAVDVHKKALKIKGAFCSGYDYSTISDGTDSYRTMAGIYVKWNMKNGRTILRRYDIDLSNEEVVDAYKAIFNSQEYKLGKFPMLTMDASEITKLNCSTLEGTFEKNFDKDVLKEFVDAYSKDIMNQTFDDLIKETPVLEINGTREDAKYYYDNDLYDFFIYPSFANTKAFLDKKGIPSDWRQGEDKVTKATVGMTVWDENDNYAHDEYWTTEDKKEIENALDNLMPDNLYYLCNFANKAIEYSPDRSSKLKDVSLSVNIKDTGETNTIGTVISFDDKLPTSLKEVCFPDSGEETSAVKTGTVGWMKCVSNG